MDWDAPGLPENVQIGAECIIERRGSFDRFRSAHRPGAVIGDRSRIYTWTSFNVEPSGLIVVGSDCILVGAVFMCSDYIRIGDRVTISYAVTIADSDFHPIDPDQRRIDAIANAPDARDAVRPSMMSKPVIIGDDAWIGIGAIILKGVTIGEGARIGPGAVVTRSVPPGAVAHGNPARAVVGARENR